MHAQAFKVGMRAPDDVSDAAKLLELPEAPSPEGGERDRLCETASPESWSNDRRAAEPGGPPNDDEEANAS